MKTSQVFTCFVPDGTAIVALGKKDFIMKGKYVFAAGTALAGIAAYYFWQNKKEKSGGQPLKEKERHHLTNAFARAKQVAVGK